MLIRFKINHPFTPQDQEGFGPPLGGGGAGGCSTYGPDDHTWLVSNTRRALPGTVLASSIMQAWQQVSRIVVGFVDGGSTEVPIS